MKQVIQLSVLVALFCMACNTNTAQKEEKELTPAEKVYRDSVSRIAQKHVADSLKKANPLLILPPDSMYTGEYTDKYPNGIIKFKGFFRFGKRHGQWMSFYPTGLLWSEMHYDKGLREGPNMVYYEDEKPRYTGFYKNDVQDSIWRYYDSTGVMIKKIQFYSNMHRPKELPLEKSFISTEKH